MRSSISQRQVTASLIFCLLLVAACSTQSTRVTEVCSDSIPRLPKSQLQQQATQRSVVTTHQPPAAAGSRTTQKSVGSSLYRYASLPFEIASVLVAGGDHRIGDARSHAQAGSFCGRCRSGSLEGRDRAEIRNSQSWSRGQNSYAQLLQSHIGVVASGGRDAAGLAQMKQTRLRIPIFRSFS